MTEAEILSRIACRVDTDHVDKNIVVGIWAQDGDEQFHTFGGVDGHPANEDTVFQIGSVTKMLTSLLLLTLQQKGIVRLDDGAQRYVEFAVPQRRGRGISLLDLSTHTSGLPRLPVNIHPGDMSNPYADYTYEQFAGFLASYVLPRDIGSAFEYSNVGGGLLGLALGEAAGSSYGCALTREILQPLHMTSTGFSLSDAMRERVIDGHSASLHRVPPWTFSVLEAAGGLWSSARDILTLLRGISASGDGPLQGLLHAALSVKRKTSRADLRVALGWMLTEHPEGSCAWHNGVTGGYRCFVGYAPSRRKGIVVLSNTCSSGLDALGVQLLLAGSRGQSR